MDVVRRLPEISLFGIEEKQLLLANKKPRQCRGSIWAGYKQVLSSVAFNPFASLGVREEQLLSVHREVCNRLLAFFRQQPVVPLGCQVVFEGWVLFFGEQ